MQDQMVGRNISITGYVVSIACIITICWVALRTFAPPPLGALATSYHVATTGFSSGCHGALKRCVCPRETCCADSLPTMLLFALSRGSGYASYPLIYIIFLSKAHNIRTRLQRSILSEWFNFLDLHRMHKVAGMALFFTATLHASCHLIRWSLRGNDIRFVWSSQTGATGISAFSLLPLIVIPMLPCLRMELIMPSWEYRKALHYLSWLFGIILMFHAPVMNIAWLIVVPLVVYWLDWIFSFYARSFIVESATFCCLGEQSRYVIMTMKQPLGFKECGVSTIYVMVPQISRYQWHPFCIVPTKNEPDSNVEFFCIIAAIGNWTDSLYEDVSQHTDRLNKYCTRIAWVCGPFTQIYQLSVYYDRIISISSGVGISSALSFYVRYASSVRSIYLIWACRDWELICHVVSYLVEIDNRYPNGKSATVLIYYTGSDDEQAFLSYNDITCGSHENIFIFRGRPTIERIIVSIEFIHENDYFRVNISPSYCVSMIMPRMDINNARLVTFEVLFGCRVPDNERRNWAASNQTRKGDRWQVIYCGGSKSIVKTLRQASIKHGFDLKVEELGW